MSLSLSFSAPPSSTLGLIASTGLGEEEERAPEFLEHVVMPDDTLVGICLKYKVCVHGWACVCVHANQLPGSGFAATAPVFLIFGMVFSCRDDARTQFSCDILMHDSRA